MKLLKTTGIVIGILVLLIIGFLWYMDFFTAVHPQEKEEGGYVIAGQEVVGPYSDADKYIEILDSKLKELGIMCDRGVGIYYDNPAVTPEDKCRSFVGDILENKYLDKIDDIQTKGLLIDSIPRAKSVVVEFPYRNMMSFMIGPMKVYPAFEKYMKEKNYKTSLSYEIYDLSKKKIVFVMQYED